MNEEKILKGIKALSESGFNLFASIQVKNLPSELLDFFDKEQIPYHEDDTLCLLAHGGTSLWKNLSMPLKETEHPIDQFSLLKMKEFAKNVLEDDIQILFPHKEWNIPLQRLGRFLNISRPSLLGLDISQDYGVWFAFRGAFLTKKILPLSEHRAFTSPCEKCPDKVCKAACPVFAVEDVGRFNISNCAEFRLKKDSICKDRCLARLACHYKSEHQYSMEQINYHMSAIKFCRRSGE